MEMALNFLSRRAYTEQKLTERLSGFGFNQVDINETLSRLKSWGYLNDNEYGKTRITHLQTRLKSRAFVEGDLRANGLKPELIDELLNIYYPESLEIEIARKLLRRKLQAKRQSKTLGCTFLMRSGFSENTIQRCFPDGSCFPEVSST